MVIIFSMKSFPLSIQQMKEEGNLKINQFDDN